MKHITKKPAKPQIVNESGDILDRFMEGPWFNVMILIGVLFHAVMVNHSIITGEKSKSWQTTKGEIFNSHIKTHSKSNSNSSSSARTGTVSASSNRFFEVRVEYSYSVSGKSFQGHTPTASGGWFFSNWKEADSVIKKLKENPAITVWYDPVKPENSLLETGVQDRDYRGMLVTVPSIGIVIGMVRYSFLKRKETDKQKLWLHSIMTGIIATIITALIQYKIIAVFT